MLKDWPQGHAKRNPKANVNGKYVHQSKETMEHNPQNKITIYKSIMRKNESSCKADCQLVNNEEIME